MTSPFVIHCDLLVRFAVGLLLSALPMAALAADAEPDHPDRLPQEGVPRGTVTSGTFTAADKSLFPDTVRDYTVYVPAQYKPEEPACLMVFQDGTWYENPQGPFRVPVVFDNLIHRRAMPVTVAVFVSPGTVPAATPGGKPWNNRSFEYDSMSDRYARFLVDEFLPVALRGLSISPDPNRRAICGISSGGICSFTVAWHRPDQFRRVISHIGSFTNIRGGDAYAGLVRKSEPKPLRVYLEDTSGDLDNLHGNWPLANRQLAAALKYMGYDVRLDWAEGFGHDGRHGGRLFPEALEWLWRDEPHRPILNTAGDLKGDLTLLRLLVPDAGWEKVADGFGFVDAPCADADGNVYVCDAKAGEVRRLATDDAAPSVVAREAVSGLEFGTDGRLYGCQGSKKRVITIDPRTGAVAEVATGIAANDLAATADGFLYVTETGPRKLTRIRLADGAMSTADAGIAGPNGVALSPDGGTLAVSEHEGEHVWIFRVHPDGSLDAKMPAMTLRRPVAVQGEVGRHEPPPSVAAAQGDGMAVDRSGRWYVASALGVQVFDLGGRPCGVLPAPQPERPLTGCVLGGPGHEYLYVTNGDAVFRRRLTTAIP